MKRAAKHRNLDTEVLDVLEFGPATIFRIAQRKGLPVEEVRIVLKRLRSQGLIEWRGDGESCRLKIGRATRDPSPFPRPWWPTPSVGFYG